MTARGNHAPLQGQSPDLICFFAAAEKGRAAVRTVVPYWCALWWAAAAMAPAAPPALVKTQTKPEPEPEPEVGLSAAKKRRAVAVTRGLMRTSPAARFHWCRGVHFFCPLDSIARALFLFVDRCASALDG